MQIVARCYAFTSVCMCAHVCMCAQVCMCVCVCVYTVPTCSRAFRLVEQMFSRIEPNGSHLRPCLIRRSNRDQQMGPAVIASTFRLIWFEL